MVEVAWARLFDHGTGEAVFNKSLFASGKHWTAYARRNGPPINHLDMVIQKELGAPTSWPDIVTALNKAITTLTLQTYRAYCQSAWTGRSPICRQE